MLFRLAYLGVTNTVALLRLLPMGDRDKDVEILALRHQTMVLERQLGGERVRFTRADRTWLAALLHQLPCDVLRRVRLLVRPETVLRVRSQRIFLFLNGSSSTRRVFSVDLPRLVDDHGCVRDAGSVGGAAAGAGRWL